jgi:hypothetical protein
MSNKKFLIIRPKYGLCNQLLSISKGIIFGIISNRDVIYSNFQLDYRHENNVCEFHDIIDIEHLQKILINLGLNIKIYSKSNAGSIKIKNYTQDNISYVKDFITLLINDENNNIDYLDIDNPISADIPSEYEKIYKYININIKFIDKYIKIAELIKNKLKLENYTCIHLRIEDDALNFMQQHNSNLTREQINNLHIKKYNEEFNYLKNINSKIYICSSLLIGNNINNDLYKNLKKKYNLLDKNDFITDKDFNNNREIFGIIDYIIAKDSIYFIGADWSSFSMYINEHHLFYKKAVKLLDIYNNILLLK